MTASDLLLQIRRRPSWADAIENLRLLVTERADGSKADLDGYARRYEGRRAAMVFDVVASRQRRYEVRVVPLVKKFEERPQARSLADLGQVGPGSGLDLMAAEEETVRMVAAGLHDYSSERNLDDDQGSLAWAKEQQLFRFAYRLDPYVGCVKGIGIALFAYLRMRSGADAIKPDVRVRKSLNRLGFQVPDGDDVALVILAESAAEEVGISAFALDQLLW